MCALCALVIISTSLPLLFLAVDEMMVALLDSGRRELVYSACGVLVNLMTDTNYRQSLAENGGVRK